MTVEFLTEIATMLGFGVIISTPILASIMAGVWVTGRLRSVFAKRSAPKSY